MKKVLEKVRKNKPRQQKTPKSRPVGAGNDHEDDGHVAGSWRDRINHAQTDTITVLQL